MKTTRYLDEIGSQYEIYFAFLFTVIAIFKKSKNALKTESESMHGSFSYPHLCRYKNQNGKTRLFFAIFG
jgi:hypothetical protein